MKKLFLFFLLLLASCTQQPSGRFQLESNSSDVYMVDTEKGRVWKLYFDGYTDSRTAFYPLRFTDSVGNMKTFEAIKAEP